MCYELFGVDFNLISLQTKKLQVVKNRTIFQKPKLGHPVSQRPIVENQKKMGQLSFSYISVILSLIHI